MATTLLTRPARLPAVVEDATRREFIGLLAAAGLVAACGDGGDGAQADSEGYPRTITDDRGTEVVIDQRPERVAVTDPLTGFEALLVLGVAPVQVGIRSFFDTFTGGDLGLWPWQAAALDDLGADPDRVNADEGPNIEVVAQARPDLVIGGQFWVETGGAGLRRLAPTIQVPSEFPDAVRLLAQVFALEERGEEVIAELDARIDAELEGLVPPGMRVATIYPYNDGTFYTAGTSNDQPTGLLLQAGFSLVEEIAALPRDEFGFTAPVSDERLGVLAPADVIVVTAYDVAANDALRANPLFMNLPAVQADRVVTFEQGPVAQAAAILSPLNLDIVLPLITEAAALVT